MYVVQRGTRFTGYYRKGGKRLSAGTWASYDEAKSSALRAELLGLEGASRANLTLSTYFDKWIKSVDLMPITKKNYQLTFRTYVRDRIGNSPVSQIDRGAVSSLLDQLRDDGVGRATIGQVKACLGSMFKSLVEKNQIESNPTHGIQLKRNQADISHVLEPDDFKKILQHLPSGGAKLLAQFLAVSGCRFGEATEVRVKDFNFRTGEVFIQRRVSDLGAVYNNGQRFRVIEATKSGHKRSVMLSKALLQEIQGYVSTKALDKDDLLFPRTIVLTAGKLEASRKAVPNEKFEKDGKQFQHGTLYAYVYGRCRCEPCREAKSKQYQKTKQQVKPYQKPYQKPQVKSYIDDKSHLPREVWRKTWNKAIAKSGIGWTPRTHDLRHANATQLLKNGVDVHEVKERLGHQSIKTTERYLHRIRHQQSKASEIANDFME
jgi:integrase